MITVDNLLWIYGTKQIPAIFNDFLRFAHQKFIMFEIELFRKSKKKLSFFIEIFLIAFYPNYHPSEMCTL